MSKISFLEKRLHTQVFTLFFLFRLEIQEMRVLVGEMMVNVSLEERRTIWPKEKMDARERETETGMRHSFTMEWKQLQTRLISWRKKVVELEGRMMTRGFSLSTLEVGKLSFSSFFKSRLKREWMDDSKQQKFLLVSWDQVPFHLMTWTTRVVSWVSSIFLA